MKGKIVKSLVDGRTGVVTKRIGNCLWVSMKDDGSEMSGALQYWKVVPDPWAFAVKHETSRQRRAHLTR